MLILSDIGVFLFKRIVIKMGTMKVSIIKRRVMCMPRRIDSMVSFLIAYQPIILIIIILIVFPFTCKLDAIRFSMM